MREPTNVIGYFPWVEFKIHFVRLFRVMIDSTGVGEEVIVDFEANCNWAIVY
jgi:hypothetical protein